MVTLRPSRCYREIKNKPLTRVSIHKPRLSYIKGVPASKVRQYEVGSPNQNLPVKAVLITKRAVQIRHNAIEAARIALNKELEKKAGKYFLKVLIYPHHVLRENRVATGAGADRFQEGMRQSYGIPVGTAARVREGQKLFEARVEQGKESAIKSALDMASKKLPCPCTIAFID